MKFTAMVVVLCLAAGLARAAEPAPAAPLPSDTEQLVMIREASTRGLLLFDLRQAAAIANATMRRGLSPARQAAIAGWIVEPAADADRITFYGLRGGVPYPIYTAGVAAGKATYGGEIPAANPPAMSPVQQRMVAARQAVIDIDLPKCTKDPFDILVFPPIGGPSTPLDVYLMTPKPSEYVYPMGGNYRVRVGTDNKVVDSRAFTKECHNLAANGGGARGITIRSSDLITPNEIHVYVALSTRFEMIVWTTTGGWQIKGAVIQKFVAARPAAPARSP